MLSSTAEHGTARAKFQFKNVEGFTVTFFDEIVFIFHVDDIVDILEWIFDYLSDDT